MDYAIASRYLAGPARMYFREWLEGVLGSDLIGLQTEGDVTRFELMAALCGFAKVRGGVARGGRTVRVEAVPVGPSIPEVEVAGDEPMPALAGLPEGLPLVVGVERADYTKGIPERLQAIAQAYRTGARFAYIGLAAPTRVGLPAYEDLRRSVGIAAAEARVAAASCPFVQMDQGAPWEQVVSLLRRADVVFTSSHADGMNLVPLQAAIAQAGRSTGERAVAIAGRDSGVAQVHGCRSEGLVPVDPLDIHGMAATLVAAVERRLPPMSDGFVARVRVQDATAWATRFLSILDGAE
jgi:trehalose 6-phosphate synthase